MLRDLGANFHRCDGKALAWADGFGPQSVYGGRGVHEDGVSVATLPLVQNAEGSVDGKHLRVEGLLVRAEGQSILHYGTS